MRVLVLLFLLAAGAPACKVPVFRFALERWPADDFRLLLTAPGPLEDPALRTAVEELSRSLEKQPVPINLTFDVIDLAALTDLERASLPGLEQIPSTPTLTLLPPESWKSQRPVWTGPATTDNLARIVDSPARQRCLDHLFAGESIVWFVIPSGDPEQDRPLATLLEEGLARATSTIQIPAGVIRRDDLSKGLTNIDLDDVLRSDLPLKISFVRDEISREDPAEALFLATLLGPAPPRTSEPLVVPVFGRGRTPGPVPASRLSAERIVEACRFLCGECSCQVKSGNPGFDLLFRAPWEERLDPTVLTADSEIVQDALEIVRFGTDESPRPARRPDEGTPIPVPFLRAAAIALASAGLAGLLVTLTRRSPGTP